MLDTAGPLRSCRRLFTVAVSLLGTAALFPMAVAAQVAEPSLPLPLEITDSDGYEYVLEGRADPFMPFIAPQTTSQNLDPNEIIEEDLELSGMQLFEPGQLTLVATMVSAKGRLAMVEDVTGRGYLLEEGMLIGRRGQVEEISQQQVLITETARTRAGKELITTVVMRLKKEGDE